MTDLDMATVPIADGSWEYIERGAWLFSFGAYGDTHVVVTGHPLDAEQDMTMVGWTTLKHGNCIPSWEWTFRELNETETAIIRARSGES